ncbi:MAG: hypothetical protein SVU32_05795, partial [Candidatus Nanohaloarchaea archaeon]|nr:hypothetical protein [Candidatus Nanohaloarchaea archaeon]
TFDEEGNRVHLDDDDVGEEYWIEGDDKYREASPGALYGWNAEDQPLDVDQYLSGRRASAGIVDKLAERLQYIDEGIDEVPSNGWGYD